jgi:uncharacterized protein YkwD
MRNTSNRRDFIKTLLAAPAVFSLSTSFANAQQSQNNPEPERQMSPVMQVFADAVSTSVLLRTIQVRAEHNCGELRPEATLYDAAHSHALDMYNRRFFDHISPEGLGPRERVAAKDDTQYQKLGENLWRTWGVHHWDIERTSKNVVRGWLESPGHRRVLLDPDFNIGAVAARGDEDELFVTMLYAKPMWSQY